MDWLRERERTIWRTPSLCVWVILNTCWVWHLLMVLWAICLWHVIWQIHAFRLKKGLGLQKNKHLGAKLFSFFGKLQSHLIQMVAQNAVVRAHNLLQWLRNYTSLVWNRFRRLVCVCIGTEYIWVHSFFLYISTSYAICCDKGMV